MVASTSTSGTASFPVTLDVTGNQEALFVGSSVTADIIVSQQADIIAVPAGAITTADGTSTVTNVVDGADVPAEITTGETVGGQVVVTAGLAEGDTIVIETAAPSASDDDSLTPQGQGQFPDGGELPDFGTDGYPQPPEGFQPGGQMGGPNR